MRPLILRNFITEWEYPMSVEVHFLTFMLEQDDDAEASELFDPWLCEVCRVGHD